MLEGLGFFFFIFLQSVIYKVTGFLCKLNKLN